MHELTANGRPLAPLELARSFSARSKGLLGRDGIEGALMLQPASSVHTFGMRFAIDVAYLTSSGSVLAMRTMKPNRLGLPRLRTRAIVEAEAGAFGRWGVQQGDILLAEPVPDGG